MNARLNPVESHYCATRNGSLRLSMKRMELKCFFFKQSGSKRGDERENDERFGEDTSDNQIGFGFKRSQTIVLTVNNRNRINPYYRATVTIIKAFTNYMNTRKSDPKGG